jgi:hypothetical protein
MESNGRNSDYVISVSVESNHLRTLIEGASIRHGVASDRFVVSCTARGGFSCVSLPTAMA